MLMLKKYTCIHFLLLFVVIKGDVQAASREVAIWDNFMSFFGNTLGCQRAQEHVIPMEENGQPVEGLALNVTFNKTSPAVNKRDEVDAATRVDILETIERLKVKFAPALVDTLKSPCLTLAENTLILTCVEICDGSELKMHDRSAIRKLVITDTITEENKDLFFLKLSEFQNIEELIITDCCEIEAIPVDKLKALPKLRHLELHKIYMDIRYVGGYHDEGVRISDLLDVLEIPSLQHFTLQASNLTKYGKEGLQRHAQKKGAAITIHNI